MIMKDVSNIIKSFVLDSFPTGSPDFRLEEDTSFLESGLIDSMGVLELVDFLEGQFGIEVGDAELVPENLDSIRNICGYLESKGISAAGA
jgi:acyl carrier protein